MADNHGLDTVWLTSLLKKSIHHAKPVDVVKIHVKSAVPKGENYSSLVYRVKLICLLASGKRKTYSMIVKTELPSNNAKEVLKAFSVFRTEIKNYTNTLSKFEDMMIECGDKRELLWPNFYGFVPYNVVAMEDLSDKGYAVAPRRNCLDLKHSLLVLRNIARFHAMGKVLLSNGLLNNDDKGSFISRSLDEGMRRIWAAMFVGLANAMLSHWGEEWADISKKVRNQKDVVAHKIVELAQNYDQRFEVLNHGDLWTTNILFQYLEYDDIPIGVKFVDFQACHLNSFIWDVESFINSSVVPPIRRENKSLLLESYQTALEKNLKFFNYSGYIPTLEDVKSESVRIIYRQMAMTTMNSPMSAETTKAFDMEKVMTHPPEEVIAKCVFTDGKAQKWLADDFKHYAEIGII